MAIKIVVGGKVHKYVLQIIEPSSLDQEEAPSTGPGTRVLLHRQKRAGLKIVDTISAELSMVEGAQRLRAGEFYLRDYNHRELVDALVDQELIEPVPEYNPVQSGYVSFWVYRISQKGLSHTIHSVR